MKKIKEIWNKLITNIKKLFSKFKESLNTPEGLKKIGAVLVALIAVLLVARLAATIYTSRYTKKIECKYESAVSDYSKIKIEETITNYFVKNKRSKLVQKTVYTVLKKDKETLNSMKTDKKMYAQTFKEIKGASASYKASGYKITTKVTYNLNKMEEDKLKDLNITLDSTYDDIKKHYEGYGYTCK